MRHLYQCSSDYSSPNLKMWVRSATKKVILTTHMELDMFLIQQISSYCCEINHTENHSDPHHRKSRANAILKIKCDHINVNLQVYALIF